MDSLNMRDNQDRYYNLILDRLTEQHTDQAVLLRRLEERIDTRLGKIDERVEELLKIANINHVKISTLELRVTTLEGVNKSRQSTHNGLLTVAISAFLTAMLSFGMTLQQKANNDVVVSLYKEKEDRSILDSLKA